MVDLSTLPGGLNSGAIAVSDKGQVVGFSTIDGNSGFRPTVWIIAPTTLTTLATLTSRSTSTAAGWYPEPVTVGLTATDEAGPGVAQNASRIGDGPAIVAEGDSVSFTIVQEGETVVSFYAVNREGNAEAPNTVTVKIDQTPPTISIGVPPSGRRFLQNEIVIATYGCVDVLTGVASCDGPVPNGTPYDTTALANFNFFVHARDYADNTASVAQNYSVITPAEAIEQLLILIAQFELPNGITTSLSAKLQHASASLIAANAGQRQDAIHKLPPP
jgi:hypothetical protein